MDNDSLKGTIAENLTVALKKEGFSYAEMQRRLEADGHSMSLPAVRNYFIGERQVPTGTLLAIIKVFNSPKPKGNYKLTDFIKS